MGAFRWHDGAMTTQEQAPAMGRGVVVGLDGSPGSRHALKWLLRQNSFGLEPVVPVLAYELPVTADGLTPLGMVGDEQAHIIEAENLLKTEVKSSGLIKTTADGSELESENIGAVLGEGRPGAVLVAEGSIRELVVVGCRGRSAMAEIVLGSVGSYCVMHANVPVAIVPKTANAQKPVRKIVVGIDGSSNSQAALQWAVDHSKSDCTIEAVAVYSLAPFASIGITTSAGELESQSTQLVNQALSEVEPHDDMPQLAAVVLEGDPRNSLRAQAEKADLIVLGSRGHKGVAHLLLGSVATSLTHHPTAATVVVPA